MQYIYYKLSGTRGQQNLVRINIKNQKNCKSKINKKMKIKNETKLPHPTSHNCRLSTFFKLQLTSTPPTTQIMRHLRFFYYQHESKLQSSKNTNSKISGIRREPSIMATAEERMQVEDATNSKNSTNDNRARKSGVTLAYKRKSR